RQRRAVDDPGLGNDVVVGRLEGQRVPVAVGSPGNLAAADAEVEPVFRIPPGEPSRLRPGVRPRGEHPGRRRLVDAFQAERGMDHGVTVHGWLPSCWSWAR